MPGFDRTGPMGMGPMTGGARGFCDPYSRTSARTGSMPWLRGGRGRGRGYRNMYWATGLPGWMRSGQSRREGLPFPAPYSKEQEMDLLKEHAAFVRSELDA
ncbi:DUF5320 domain-containing protein, partial [Thermodesulfobacteriota bacterium]